MSAGRRSRGLLVAALGWLTACGAPERPAPAAGEASRTRRAAEGLFSEPAEYAPRPPSAEAGHRYFAELGVGDPYGAGVPYPVYRALMAQYPERLGADFGALSERFGFIAGDDPGALPVGFHRTRDPNTGVDFLMTNCTICHAGRVRTAQAERVVEGLGNRRVRIHAYALAFARIATDPELSVSSLGAAAADEAERLDLAWPPSHRRVLVEATIRGLRERFASRLAPLERLGEGLPGRVATMEGFMIALDTFMDADLRLPEVIGWARVPDVAVWQHRDTNSFDGAADGSPVALVAEADFAFGVRPRWYEEHRHIATSMFLYLRHFERDLPFPGPIDEALATEGYEAFEARCAGCHGHYAAPGESTRPSYRERIVPVEVVGTDPARLESVTEPFVRAANAAPATRGLVHTRRSGGYVPRPLVDVWARGQYGHNGQWPDLAVLATPPEERPTRFVVDPAAPLDLERVGQRWRPADEGPPGPGEYLYDGTRPGYGVQGHPFLGAAPEGERRAILAYLRTL
ncbi:MAG TPA: hypothetical protein RMH99_22530 [Sandaracinaceae bacterium LLY-WYZ-13_1]|nr:hypothetical protein [Sandaracinaceae bacterium LLY-WYZ-13_1]